MSASVIIVILIIIIAVISYRLLSMPDYERIINKVGDSLWLVDKSGVGEGTSYYIRFGKFSRDGEKQGRVKFTKYGMNKEFEYDADLDWTGTDDALRVGQMRLTLVPGRYGAVPTIMFINDVDAVSPSRAPLREVTVTSVRTV
jgi:hypothetical protein